MLKGSQYFARACLPAPLAAGERAALTGMESRLEDSDTIIL